MTSPTLQLLGRPLVQRAGDTALQLGPLRPHQVLAVLGWLGSRAAVPAADGWVGREWLASLVWSGCTAAQGRANLRKVLLDLRAMGLPGWEEGPRGLRWRPGSDQDHFADLLASQQWPAAAQAGRGIPLQGLDGGAGGDAFAGWLRQQRQHHHQRWRAAVLRALATATPEAAAEWVDALLQADPHDREALALVRRYATSQLAPVSSMVGRDNELHALLTLLARHRLVTVLGPGGVGKSRLARHAADACAAQYAQGCVLVTLDDLSTPAALPDRVASALGLTLAPHASPAPALARALAPRAMLLVLDGFEAVIDAAQLAPLLLAAAPGLRLLITSRERLDVDGECLLPLAGLEVPARTDDAAVALQSPAVRLFASRALAVQPQFDLAQALPAVADICRRVGGLPLAIEWAAAWMRVLPAADLAREIAAGAAGLGDAGPVAVFESSWRLLTASERLAYASLAVFRGGFSREAAAEVAGVQLPMLAALVDKSMLRASASGRLDMHPLVQDHASTKLASIEQAPALVERHAAWYLRLLHQRAPLPASENENLLVAWRHVVQQRNAAAVEAALARMLWTSVLVGRRDEAVGLLQAAAAHFGTSTAAGANLQAHQAWIQLWGDQDETARTLAQSALAVLREAAHPGGIAMCLRTLGHAARRACQPAIAVSLFEQALTLSQPGGLGDLRAALQDALAMALIQDGQFERARAQLRLALAFNDAAGDDVQRTYNHYNFSQSHSQAGQPELALPWARSALDIGRGSGFPFFMPYVHAELARVLAALGQLGPAQEQAQEALTGARSSADTAALAGALEAQSRVVLRRGDAAAARALVREAARHCLATGNRAVGQTLLPAALAAFAGAPQAALWAQLPVVDALLAIAAHSGSD
jgi:predicted ATPase